MLIAVTLSVLLTPLFVLLVWLAFEDRAHRAVTRSAGPDAVPVGPGAAAPAAVTDYATVPER